mmetsp:Transcript_52153/g.124243  ORF Transcript_52153/g.124243 Transcript_52153/m.124243 type:complete len:208 (+) Transcript_52153:1632-2255(+)
MTTCLTATPESRSFGTRRPVSEDESPVGMHTTKNSALDGSCSRSSNICMRSRNFSAFSLSFSPPCLMLSLSGALKPSCAPRNEAAWLTTSREPPSLSFSASALVIRREIKRGYSRRRRVWPVGAVSITTLSKLMISPRAVFASPSSTSEITLLSATSSSAPGGAVSKMSVISDKPSFEAIESVSSLLSPAIIRLNSSTASFRSTSRA